MPITNLEDVRGEVELFLTNMENSETCLGHCAQRLLRASEDDKEQMSRIKQEYEDLLDYKNAEFVGVQVYDLFSNLLRLTHHNSAITAMRTRSGRKSLDDFLARANNLFLKVLDARSSYKEKIFELNEKLKGSNIPLSYTDDSEILRYDLGQIYIHRLHIYMHMLYDLMR